MRIKVHKGTFPYEIRLGDIPAIAAATNDKKILDYKIHICHCGLSKHKPFCDGSHVHAQNEGDSVYIYPEGKEREKVTDKAVLDLLSKINEE